MEDRPSQRSTDGGVTWREIAAPRYPPKPEGYVPRVPVEGKAANWSLAVDWGAGGGGSQSTRRDPERNSPPGSVPHQITPG